MTLVKAIFDPLRAVTDRLPTKDRNVSEGIREMCQFSIYFSCFLCVSWVESSHDTTAI